MEDKTKFYIFDKKEIALIFAFMILASFITFFLGIKYGKSFSDQKSCITPEDRKMVELRSSKEEVVEGVEQKHVDKKLIIDEMNSQLEKEINNLGEKNEPDSEVEKDVNSELKLPTPETSAVDSKKNESDVIIPKSKNDEFYNKYTIQLGSYQSIDDAKEFANGFKVRGYDPIINEATIPSKGGVWYRVSIGIFESSSAAKEYIINNNSLFQSHNDYVIGKFD